MTADLVISHYLLGESVLAVVLGSGTAICLTFWLKCEFFSIWDVIESLWVDKTAIRFRKYVSWVRVKV